MQEFHITKQELQLFRKVSKVESMKDFLNSKINTVFMEFLGKHNVARFFATNGHIALLYIKSGGDKLNFDDVDHILKVKPDPRMIKVSGEDMDKVLLLARAKSDIMVDASFISIDGFTMNINTKVDNPDDVFNACDIFPDRNQGGRFPSPDWANIDKSGYQQVDPGRQIDYRACSVSLNTRYLAMHTMIANALGIQHLSDRAGFTLDSVPATQISLPLKFNGPVRFDTLGKKRMALATLVVMPIVKM